MTDNNKINSFEDLGLYKFVLNRVQNIIRFSAQPQKVRYFSQQLESLMEHEISKIKGGIKDV